MQDLLSFESCRSSAVDDVEKISLESSGQTERASGDEWDCREGKERKRRRCVETGTRRRNGDVGNQIGFARGGRRQRGP